MPVTAELLNDFKEFRFSLMYSNICLICWYRVKTDLPSPDRFYSCPKLQHWCCSLFWKRSHLIFFFPYFRLYVFQDGIHGSCQSIYLSLYGIYLWKIKRSFITIACIKTFKKEKCLLQMISSRIQSSLSTITSKKKIVPYLSTQKNNLQFMLLLSLFRSGFKTEGRSGERWGNYFSFFLY